VCRLLAAHVCLCVCVCVRACKVTQSLTNAHYGDEPFEFAGKRWNSRVSATRWWHRPVHSLLMTPWAHLRGLRRLNSRQAPISLVRKSSTAISSKSQPRSTSLIVSTADYFVCLLLVSSVRVPELSGVNWKAISLFRSESCWWMCGYLSIQYLIFVCLCCLVTKCNR